MTFPGLLRHVALVRTDVSEELNAFFIRVTRIGELGTRLAVTSNRRTLRRIRSYKQLRLVHNLTGLWTITMSHMSLFSVIANKRGDKFLGTVELSERPHTSLLADGNYPAHLCRAVDCYLQWRLKAVETPGSQRLRRMSTALSVAATLFAF
jgi:hypothetical protein